jgi:hypothetical protein
VSGILGTGGLPDRRPDQTRNPPLSGTQPGSSAGIVRARLVIVSGTAEGVFIYNGTPGAGNPPIFSATSGTTDPYGNTVIPTLQIQGGGALTVGAAGAPEVVLVSNAAITVAAQIPATGSAPTNVTSFGELEQVIEFPSHNTHESSPAIIGQTLITYTNGETADALLYLSGEMAGTQPQGTFRLDVSRSSGNTYNPVIIEGQYKVSGSAVTLIPVFWRDMSLGVSGLYYEDPSEGSGLSPTLVIGAFGDGNLVPATYDTWHSVAAGNSWTGTIYYKLTLDNEVYLWSNNLASPAAAVNGVTIASFGTQYTPNVSMTFGVQEVQASNAGFAFRLTLSNTGTLFSTGVSASVGVCLGQRVPLDLP